MSHTHTFRIVIHPDYEPYEHGDYSPGKAGERQRARVEAAIERDGLWGYVIERRLSTAPTTCAACGHSPTHEWENVDSCWGFIGVDGMRDYWAGELPYGVEIPIYDADDVRRFDDDAVPSDHVTLKPRRKAKEVAK